MPIADAPPSSRFPSRAREASTDTTPHRFSGILDLDLALDATDRAVKRARRNYALIAVSSPESSAREIVSDLHFSRRVAMIFVLRDTQPLLRTVRRYFFFILYPMIRLRYY